MINIIVENYFINSELEKSIKLFNYSNQIRIFTNNNNELINNKDIFPISSLKQKHNQYYNIFLFNESSLLVKFSNTLKQLEINNEKSIISINNIYKDKNGNLFHDYFYADHDSKRWIFTDNDYLRFINWRIDNIFFRIDENVNITNIFQQDKLEFIWKLYLNTELNQYKIINLVSISNFLYSNSEYKNVKSVIELANKYNKLLENSILNRKCAFSFHKQMILFINNNLHFCLKNLWSECHNFLEQLNENYLIYILCSCRLNKTNFKAIYKLKKSINKYVYIEILFIFNEKNIQNLLSPLIYFIKMMKAIIVLPVSLFSLIKKIYLMLTFKVLGKKNEK